MSREELFAELEAESPIGAQLLSDLVPDMEIDAHFYTEVLSRNPTDSSAIDATLQLLLLAPHALIVSKCEIVAFEKVDVGGKIEIRRGSKKLSTSILPLDRVSDVELTSSTGVYRRGSEPFEPYHLRIRFDDTVEPAEILLPGPRLLEDRAQHEVHRIHSQIRKFGQKLLTRLAGT